MAYIDLILSDLSNVSARSLAKVTGRIISMSPVISRFDGPKHPMADLEMFFPMNFF